MSLEKINLVKASAMSLPLKNRSVGLIIAHPPFFATDTSRYGGDSSQQINQSKNPKKFVKNMVKAVREMARVLEDDGSIWLHIGAVHGVDYLVIGSVLRKTNLKIAGTLVQSYYSNTGAEHLNSAETSTWVQLVKLPQFYCNPFLVKKYNNPIWEIPFSNEADPIDVELSKRFFVKDVVNKELPKRLIEMYSRRNAVVLDPFGGSGVVAVTAVELGRSSISIDVSEMQLEAAAERAKLTLEI